jgi:NTP pyrophosphatase (non-canonical NTP hydrolase)
VNNRTIIKKSTGSTEDFVGEGIKIPLPLLFKLTEECGELTQKVMKAVNPNSSGYGDLTGVAEEAGHVLFFIGLLDKALGGAIKKSSKERLKRTLLNPKQ